MDLRLVGDYNEIKTFLEEHDRHIWYIGKTTKYALSIYFSESEKKELYRIFMKVALIIPVCARYERRIKNQLENLRSQCLTFAGGEFVPLFVFGRGPHPSVEPFQSLEVDVEEQYSNLHLKVLEAFNYTNQRDFDFICKIDDDTLINFAQFQPEWLTAADYIGRFIEYGEDTIEINLFRYNYCDKLYLSTPRKRTSYATGACYFLSRKAIKCICDQATSPIIKDPVTPEDALVGDLLSSQEIRKKNIMLLDKTLPHLQITENCFSLHPVHEKLYQNLIGKPNKHQIEVLSSHPLNVLTRDMYLHQLKEQIQQTVLRFMDSPKSIGIG